MKMFELLTTESEREYSHGGGQVVAVLAFYSGDPSLNPAEAYSFSAKIAFEKDEHKQKEAGVGTLKRERKKETY